MHAPTFLEYGGKVGGRGRDAVLDQRAQALEFLTPFAPREPAGVAIQQISLRPGPGCVRRRVLPRTPWCPEAARSHGRFPCVAPDVCATGGAFGAVGPANSRGGRGFPACGSDFFVTHGAFWPSHTGFFAASGVLLGASISFSPASAAFSGARKPFPPARVSFPPPGFGFPPPGNHFCAPGFHFPLPGFHFPPAVFHFPLPGFDLPQPGNEIPLPGNGFCGHKFPPKSRKKRVPDRKCPSRSLPAGVWARGMR